jgi:hypothetical protein
MDLQAIKLVVTRGAGRGLLLAKKYSPEILTTVGIVGGVASSIMASRATLHLEATVNAWHSDVQDVKEVKELVGRGDTDVTTKEYNKAIAVAYSRGMFNVAKLYAPSVTLGACSIACVVSAHGIMRRRNVALIAAYKAIETSLTEYRKRVATEFGEDKEYELSQGVTHEIVEDEKGKKKTVANVDPNGISQYGRFFDETCQDWSKIPDYNVTYVRLQQNIANDRMQSFGHIFLNEVYDLLGLPRSKAGQIVGWVRGEGDTYIDFGIDSLINDKAREFVNGYEPAIFLDFNVNGIIYDLI